MLTIETLREIAYESGFRHAQFCLEQAETEMGADATRHLWAALDRLSQEDRRQCMGREG